MGADMRRLARHTRALESTPPERHVPTGTSERRWRSTAEFNSSQNASTTSEPCIHVLRQVSTSTSQYSQTSNWPEDTVYRAEWAGGSDRMFRKNVSGPSSRAPE